MSLIATRLQNWRVEDPEFDRNMTRPCEYGALDFFVEQTDARNSIINPRLRERAFASIGNTVQIPVINYDENVQVSNVRSCVIADNENTSALYTVTWATYAVGFTMVPAAYMNNEISYEHDWLRKMEKISRAMANALDSAAVAQLVGDAHIASLNSVDDLLGAHPLLSCQCAYLGRQGIDTRRYLAY